MVVYNMSIEMLIALGMVLIALISVGCTWLKKKGLWTITLLCVSIAEQICDFFELSGAGKKKYSFVSNILLMINPKLTDAEIEIFIETMVTRMKEVTK